MRSSSIIRPRSSSIEVTEHLHFQVGRQLFVVLPLTLPLLGIDPSELESGLEKSPDDEAQKADEAQETYGTLQRFERAYTSCQFINRQVLRGP
jgi:hypothetical protein